VKTIRGCEIHRPAGSLACPRFTTDKDHATIGEGPLFVDSVKKYLGTETYTYKQAGEVRVMYKIQAERVNGFSFPHAEHLSS
jgi:hypothetical protein